MVRNVNDPTLHANVLPIPQSAVEAFAEATRKLWVACLRSNMPMERADALVKEPAALQLAAALFLTRFPAVTSPRRLVQAKGYFVARVVSLHAQTLVLLLPDTTNITVSRGIHVKNDTTTTVDFQSTYPTARTGHFMFRRLDCGETVKRVCAIEGAEFLR